MIECEQLYKKYNNILFIDMILGKVAYTQEDFIDCTLHFSSGKIVTKTFILNKDNNNICKYLENIIIYNLREC